MGIPDNIQNKHPNNPILIGIQARERLSEKESERIRLETLCKLEEPRIATLL